MADDQQEGNDEKRMTLSAKERAWALAIKAAVEKDEELEPLSDFWYAQMAIVDKGNLSLSLERVSKLQDFRQEYGIVEGTSYVQTGTQRVQEFVRFLPEFWMALSFHARGGNYVLVTDLSKTHNRFLRREEDCWITRMRATYFIHHAMSPDLEAIRQGPVLLCENEGFDWKKNFGHAELQRMWGELLEPYPHQYRQVKNFHTGMFLNLVISMARAFIPAETYKQFQMGCQSEAGNLGSIFLKPTVPQANKRLIENTRRALQRRYDNEASFKL